MIYAQISNGLVANIIQVDDVSVVPLFTDGYDACIRIDNITPQPCIGWSYDGNIFTNQITMPIIGSLANVPTGSATTFDPFVLSDASGGYMVSVNGQTISVGCQNYDYVSLRYVLYVLLVEKVGSIGPFTETSSGFSQNNKFLITPEDFDLIYAALCSLK